MKLDELIYKRFTECGEITKRLASYLDLPAIFYSEVPEKWTEEQYPRICYSYDMQTNQERKSAGNLIVTLMCENSPRQTPESIEPQIQKCLRDVILAPKGESPYCFSWNRSEAFTYRKTDGQNMVTNDLIIGCDIWFDILEYPSQETTDPDPIVAVNRYIKALYPGAIVLGYDAIPDILEASGGNPIFYSRLNSVTQDRETNTIAWMSGKISIHLLCPEQDIRMKMSMALTNQLNLDGEVIMLDFSPMFIDGLSANYQADYLTEGQLGLAVRYGLLRYKSKERYLTGIEIKGGL